MFLAAAKVGGIVFNNTYRADFIFENMMIQLNVIHHSYLNGVKKLLFLGSSGIYPKLAPQHFRIVDKDHNRPWGDFFVIADEQAPRFADVYFDGLDVSSLKISGKLSPKILIAALNKRLSWQYHHRRAEIRRVIQGQAGVVSSNTDSENELEVLNVGATVTLLQGKRHRLVGLKDYAVVAEIWQHTDAENPSDENDIVRLQDDFGR